MSDYRNLLVGTIIVLIIIYLMIKTQPKTELPKEPSIDVSKSGEPKAEKLTKALISNTRVAKDGYRTNEKLINFSGIAELEHMSIEPHIRRNSPVIGSRRYSNSGRRVLGEQGFITVI